MSVSAPTALQHTPALPKNNGAKSTSLIWVECHD
jgi:hypothetical protein